MILVLLMHDHDLTGEGIDYDSGPYPVKIYAEDIRVGAFLFVSLNDDNILEEKETFNVFINTSSLPSRFTVVDPYQATVTIVDNDGNYVII